MTTRRSPLPRHLGALGLLSVLALSPLARPVPTEDPAPSAEEQAVRLQLRRRLEHPPEDRPPSIGPEAIHASRTLPAVYESRIFTPVWSPGLEPSPRALELVGAIQDADAEGLKPTDYHLDAIEGLLERVRATPDPVAAGDLDILLTDAFLILGAHLVSGRVDPETFDPEWFAIRREVDLTESLAVATRDGPRTAFRELLPAHPGYRLLREALRRTRVLEAAGGWRPVGPGPVLRPGDRDDAVPRLRARLAATEPGSAPPDVGPATVQEDPAVYDDPLVAAVRAFQERHGLEPDGVVGEKTRAALDVPIDERTRQLELNLERWRWLPRHLGDRYVLVNIPAFSVALVEDEERTLEMRAVVGRSYRRTPVFSDAIRYLVLNPSWDVPHRLAVQDKLPEIRKDPGYLGRMGFRVFRESGGERVEVDAADVDWTAVDRSRFPYRLRQAPGPLNALGRVKFMFPNRFNVYLHDTPERGVFRKPERDVSSGCIRLEKPMDLAERLLAGSDRWTRETLDAAIATGRETVVPLPAPVPVHLLYWTAWAADDGTIHFRRDVYGRDALLAEALARTPDAEAATRDDSTDGT